MSKSFQEFAHQWSFAHMPISPRYPQSNGKAEYTVKSMKKIIRAAWSGREMKTNSPELYITIATLHHAKINNFLLKSYPATPYKTTCQLTDEHSDQNGKNILSKWKRMLLIHVRQ